MQRSGRLGSHFRHVLQLIWPEALGFVRARVALVLLLIIVSSVLMSLAPLALKMVVDRFSAPAASAAFSAFALISFYVISQWLTKVLTEVRTFTYSRVERRINRILSRQLYDHLMQLPLRYHLERRTGAINQLIANGIQGFQIILQQAVLTLLPVTLEVLTAAVVLLHLRQAQFLMLFVGALLCFAATFALTVFRIAKPAREAHEAQVQVIAVMTDSLLNYETVKYFAAEPLINRKIDSTLSTAENVWLRFFKVRVWNGMSIATVSGVFFAVTLTYAAWRVQQGRMTAGDFVLILMYMFQVTRPAEMVGAAVQQLTQGRALLEQLMDFIYQAPEPRGAEKHAAGVGGGKLTVENVGVAYDANRSLLKDVSFEVLPGRMLGIVGTSGAGKSTLVRLLVRLLEVEQGRILLDDVPIATLPLAQLRQSIAVVPQDTVLFDASIAYNIEFGRPGSTQEDIVRAAQLADIHEFIMSLPQRYETRVGERGVKLSGGERQRIAIARAAIKRPRIYVFDEPTSSLDSQTEAQILRKLRAISRSSTTLMITHRLSTVRHADQIVVLHEGSIAERGTHEALLRANGRYAALWRAQEYSATLHVV